MRAVGMLLLLVSSLAAADTTPGGKVAVRGDRLELAEPIAFDTGKATIKPASQALLDEVARALAGNAQIAHLEIGVHTDARGADDYNLKMSEARAAAIKHYLVALGVDAKRLEARGYGETRPLCSEPNEGCWARNRRVELLIK